jgi:hypothetical protein
MPLAWTYHPLIAHEEIQFAFAKRVHARIYLVLEERL